MFKTKTVSHCYVLHQATLHVKQNQVLLIFPGIPTRRELVLFSDNMIVLLLALLIQHVFMFPG